MNSDPPIESARKAHPQQSGFPAERMTAIRNMETRHFWFRARDAMIKDAVSERTPEKQASALELGCGTGRLASWLTELGYQTTGLDTENAFIEEAGRQNPTTFFTRGYAEHLPFPDKSFDLITALDVFEHTEDEAAFAESFRVLKPGGRIIMTVPAMQCLFSFRDRDAGHKRRYAKAELSHKLEKSGYKITTIRYFNFLLLPLVFLSRYLGRKTANTRDTEDNVSGIFNEILYYMMVSDISLGKKIPFPAGSSLYAICTR